VVPIYRVVRRENGWAYRLQKIYSAVFSTQAEAIGQRSQLHTKCLSPGSRSEGTAAVAHRAGPAQKAMNYFQ
jgi:hypothetical protein